MLQQEFLASLLSEAEQADDKKKVVKLKAIQQAIIHEKIVAKAEEICQG